MWQTDRDICIIMTEKLVDEKILMEESPGKVLAITIDTGSSVFVVNCLSEESPLHVWNIKVPVLKFCSNLGLPWTVNIHKPEE